MAKAKAAKEEINESSSESAAAIAELDEAVGKATGEAESEAAETTVAEAEPVEAAASVEPARPSLSGLREYAKQYQVPVDRYGDDEAFARDLLAARFRVNEAEQWRETAGRYAKHAPEFERWLSEREKQEASQVKKPQTPWEAMPEFDPAWLSMVETDAATGTVKPGRGAPPDVVERIRKYESWHTDTAKKLVTDFPNLVKPLFEQLFAEKFQAELGTMQQKQLQNQIMEQNQDWLFQKDNHGYLYGNDQQPILSDLGRRYFGYAAELDRAGVKDTYTRHVHALKLLQADHALAGANGAGASEKNGVLKQKAIENATRIPNRNGSAQANHREVDHSGEGLTFAEMALGQFRNDGISTLD